MSWRATASIRLLVIISLIAMMLLLLASSVGAGTTVETTLEHRVTSGETLWEIAGEYTPEGESIHWTNWDIALPRIRDVLAGGAVLALAYRAEGPMPWDAELRTLIGRYSTNRDYAPYDIVEELTSRGFLEVLGRARTDDVPFTQTRDEYVDALHSRNGFSRTRMGVSTKVFDAKFRDLLLSHGIQESVELTTWSELIWGRIP